MVSPIDHTIKLYTRIILHISTQKLKMLKFRVEGAVQFIQTAAKAMDSGSLLASTGAAAVIAGHVSGWDGQDMTA